MSILIPDAKAMLDFMQDATSYLASQQRRTCIKVNVRKLGAADSQKFDEARKQELGEWLNAQAIKSVSKSGVPAERIMEMRCVYT